MAEIVKLHGVGEVSIRQSREGVQTKVEGEALTISNPTSNLQMKQVFLTNRDAIKAQRLVHTALLWEGQLQRSKNSD